MTAPERDDAVLRALRAAAPSTVSGEALAAELGVSRVAVGKRIGVLRAQGYGIEAAAGQGYRLVSAPDLPLPAEVRPLLASSGWLPLGGGVTGSTNDDAKRLAREGAPEGTVVLAGEQTGGRGRLGREWASPPGGVYLSAVLRPDLAPSETAPLPLVVGVGVARALEHLGAEVRLKWPNDVYCADGRKVAGILVEMSAEAERVEWLVAGIGVNVRADRTSAPGACFLDEVVAQPAGLARVAAAVLDGLAEALRDFEAGGFDALRPDYERRAWLTSRDVVVRDIRGDVRASGRVAGVDESGRLVLEGPQGPAVVATGEVTLRVDV